MGLTWTPDLEIGHETIDRQHIQLFGLLDEFSESCAKGKAQEALILIYGQLKEYAEAHFREEEELMRTSNYPDIEKHQHGHRFFEEDLMEMGKKISAKNLTMLDVIHMNEFLVNWLVNHVKKSDKRFGDFLRDSENK